jgi:hypothetical protein
MANYEINLTATQIEAALNKAHAPATAVDSTQNLVESGAIKTYVDTQVSAGASITTASFAGSALEDSTEGLTATDTAIPTSAAVKDYVDSSGLPYAICSVTDGNSNATSFDLTFSIQSQASNIASISSGNVALVSGVYMVFFTGGFAEDDSDTGDYYTVTLRRNGVSQGSFEVNETGSSSSYLPFTVTSVDLTGGSTWSVNALENDAARLYWKDVTMLFLKVA